MGVNKNLKKCARGRGAVAGGGLGGGPYEKYGSLNFFFFFSFSATQLSEGHQPSAGAKSRCP